MVRELVEEKDPYFEDLAALVRACDLEVVEKNHSLSFPVVEFSFWKRALPGQSHVQVGDVFLQWVADILYDTRTSNLLPVKAENIPLEVFIGVSNYLEQKFQKKVVLNPDVLPESFRQYYS